MRAINLACLAATELSSMFYCGASRAARQSSFCRRSALRSPYFYSASQADGRRGGYKLRRRTAVATALPFMRRLILVRHVFYAVRGIVLRRNFINLSARRFLKFRIVIGLIVDLNFTAKCKAVDKKHKSRLGSAKAASG